MASYFGKATFVTALSPVLIIGLLSIFFLGELPGVKILIVIFLTSFFLAINHVLVKKVGLMKAVIVGIFVMVINYHILVA